MQQPPLAPWCFDKPVKCTHAQPKSLGSASAGDASQPVTAFDISQTFAANNSFHFILPVSFQERH
jgi:hypothetical protein